ncbi:MAG: hypothetical protein FWH15_07780 [Betaproteobacteria bacterium]|nr:hypothetical protein [Betaproteobacteria bacterium]
MKLTILSLFALFALLALSACRGDAPETKESLIEIETSSFMKELEKKQREVATERVIGVIPNPGSAQFRNQTRLCGEVNIKENSGSYSGYVRFIAGGKADVHFDNARGTLITSESEKERFRALFDEMWEQVCEGEPTYRGFVETAIRLRHENPNFANDNLFDMSLEFAVRGAIYPFGKP